MSHTYSYACRDYPGMEGCAGEFTTASEDELWKAIELHASVAHGEDPAAWTAEDRAYLATLIRRDAGQAEAAGTG